MSCQHCENTVHNTSSYKISCPHCATEHRHDAKAAGTSAQQISHEEKQTSHEKSVREAAHVEVLSPEEVRQQYSTGQSHTASENATKGERVTFWSFTQSGGSQQRIFQSNPFQGAGGFGGSNVSCLPSLILLATAVGLIIQFGFFAGLGFLFFYAIGSVVSMALFVRSALQGRGAPLTLWARRVLVWCASFLLTIFLAS